MLSLALGRLGTILEAMTNNETSFFRDKRAFQAFRYHVIPQLLTDGAPSRRIRIWCGASSTGQEPYSVALTLKSFAARVAQHETDHLDGVLFFDRMKSMQSLTFLDEYSRFWAKDED